MTPTIIVDMESICIARGPSFSSPEDKYGIYNAQPAVLMIEKMTNWYKAGYKVIIECRRDVDTDYEVTHQWLDHYEVPYSETVVWRV